MSFLLSFASTFIWSMATILRKKALNISTISALSFLFVGNIIIFGLSIILYFSANIKSIFQLNLWIIFLISAWIILQLIYSPVNQQLYKENKISEMLPFNNLNKIFSILFAFLFFHQWNLIAFLISIITLIVIILFTIDFKTYKLPKKIHHIFFVEIWVSIRIIIVGYILLKINALELFVYTSFLSVILNWALALKWSLMKDLQWISIKLVFYRSLPALLWGINVLIWYYLIQSLWLLFSNLLSFMWLAFTMILSFMFFWDKPTKKNIAQSLIITILVAIGFYFK